MDQDITAVTQAIVIILKSLVVPSLFSIMIYSLTMITAARKKMRRVKQVN
jgi:hypothetical protein